MACDLKSGADSLDKQNYPNTAFFHRLLSTQKIRKLRNALMLGLGRLYVLVELPKLRLGRRFSKINRDAIDYNHGQFKWAPLLAYFFGMTALAAGLVFSGRQVIVRAAASLHSDVAANRPTSRVERGLQIHDRVVTWQGQGATTSVIAPTVSDLSVENLTEAHGPS